MTAIATVHVVFKTHLDLGFTDLAGTVRERYLERYLPAAIRMARRLRESGGTERFVWTTGSWLIAEALDHGSRLLRRELEEAIVHGDIRWHALPFTTHTELMDAGLVRAGLRLSRDLDRRFGFTTIAAKMTDVPGHTRSLVPLLAEAGVRLLHIGVNPASSAPRVPDDFRWRVDGAEVVVCYDRAGYGAVRTVPGCDAALALAHTGDNHGPQDPEEVRKVFAAMRERFPGAQVLGSTLDAFAIGLLPVAEALPTVEDELGDTWIHGVGSDPRKVARFRALLRRRQACLAADPAAADTPAWRAADRALLCVAEHTWGRDTKKWVPGPNGGPWRAQVEDAWATPDFALKRRRGAYAVWEETWREQRTYLDQAEAALAGTPWAASCPDLPTAPPTTGLRAWEGDRLDSGAFSVGVDRATGAVTSLRVRGREWAGVDRPWFAPHYQVLGAADYERFIAAYNPDLPGTASWALTDFAKPGLERVQPTGAGWHAQAVAWRIREDDAGLELRADLRFPDAPSRDLGAPARLIQRILLPRTGMRLRAELHWLGKPACRIPEALWWSIRPAGVADAGWAYRKLGRDIDPRQVVDGGNRHLHAVERIAWADAAGGFALTPLDSALAAPGEPRLLAFGLPAPHPRDGVHLCLLDTAWGTNFPMWSDEDGTARVEADFS